MGGHGHGPARLDGDGAVALAAVVAPAPRRRQQKGEGDGEATHGERILCAAVGRPTAILCAAAAALVAAGCGGEIEVPKSDATAHEGAELFNERCSGCHSLDAANAYGSKPPKQKQGGERTNGPNFNVRKESRDDVLFAIRNGGFSGGDHARERGGRRGRRGDRRLPVQVLRQGRLARGRRGRRARPQGDPRGPGRGARGACARAASTWRCWTRRSSSTSAGARCCPSWRSCARAKNEASKRIGELQRSGEDASEAIAEVKRGRPGARRSWRRSCARWRSGAAALLAALPNLPDPTAPPEDEVLREEGRGGARPAATTWSCWASTSAWRRARAWRARASST